MQTSPVRITSEICRQSPKALGRGNRRAGGTHDRVDQEEHVERSAEEHAEQLMRERRLAQHRIEGRQRHDGDQCGGEERVAEEARVVGVVHRLGEGARDRGHVERDLHVLERLADVLELFWPLDADASDAANYLPQAPTQAIAMKHQ